MIQLNLKVWHICSHRIVNSRTKLRKPSKNFFQYLKIIIQLSTKVTHLIDKWSSNTHLSGFPIVQLNCYCRMGVANNSLQAKSRLCQDCMYTAWELRTVVAVFFWKLSLKKKKEYFITHRTIGNLNFSIHTEGFIGAPPRPFIVYCLGCFHVPVLEFSSCDRECVPWKA